MKFQFETEELICQNCGDEYKIDDSDSEDYASFCSESCQSVSEEDDEIMEDEEYE